MPTPTRPHPPSGRPHNGVVLINCLQKLANNKWNRLDPLYLCEHQTTQQTNPTNKAFTVRSCIVTLCDMTK